MVTERDYCACQSLTLVPQPVAAQLADPDTQHTVELCRACRNDREGYSWECPVQISAETVTTRLRFSSAPAGIIVDSLLHQ